MSNSKSNSTDNPMKAIRLADFDEKLPPVELRPAPGSPRGTKGREIDIITFDGACAELYEEYERTEDHKILWKIAARILPDATPEEIKRLTAGECIAAIAIASGKASNILEAIKKSDEKDAAGSGDSPGTEGNRKAPPSSKAKGRRRRTGSPS